MNLELKLADLDTFKELVEAAQYLAFALDKAVEYYDIDLNCDFGINDEYVDKFGKDVPDLSKYNEA